MRILFFLAILSLNVNVFAGSKEYICSASCEKNGFHDTRTFELGSGRSGLEARTNANAIVMANHKCTGGVKPDSCVVVKTDRMSNYCVANCVTDTGRFVTGTATGAYGRNRLESSMFARKMVIENYICTHGVKISACTNL